MNEQRLNILAGTVTKLLHRKAYGPLKKILQKRHPAELAYFFKNLTPSDMKILFKYCGDKKNQSEVLAEVEDPTQVFLIKSLKVEESAGILDCMDNDDLVDILENLDEELREKILNLIEDSQQEKVEELMTYDPSTAGGIMSTSFLAFSTETTASRAIEYLHSSSEEYATTFYIYVLNNARKLVGVVSLRQLVTCSPDTPLKDLMNPEVISVPLSMDQEDVARIVGRYDFLAVPVIDDQNRLVGIITVDDVIDVIQEEATEDIFKLTSAGDDIMYFKENIFNRFKSRLSGLIFPFVSGIFLLYLLFWKISYFTGAGISLLLIFPFLLLTSNVTALQTSTLVIRGISMGKIEDREFHTILFKELVTTLIFGIIAFTLFFAVSFLHPFSAYFQQGAGIIDHIQLGITIPVAFVISTTLAVMLPALYKKIGLDPASAGVTKLYTVSHFLLVLFLIIYGYFLNNGQG
ncbi:MAG: magnesium transporter [Deltaproteobacteria bacterium]|jgi:magnesium transporter|nr:magnesium transporter [Deltaproteobacteria bacterium]